MMFRNSFRLWSPRDIKDGRSYETPHQPVFDKSKNTDQDEDDIMDSANSMLGSSSDR